MIPRPKFRKWKPGRPDNYLEGDRSVEETVIKEGFTGLKTDTAGFNLKDTQLINLKNVFVKNGEIKKCYGFAQYGTNQPLDGTCWGVFERKNFEGLRELFAVTRKSLYKYVNGVWTYLKQDFLTGSNDYPVCYDLTYSETQGDVISIFTNYYDNVKYQVGTADPANLFTNWKAKYTKNYNHFQFYAYILEGGTNYPQKIYWSDIGKPQIITTGMAGGAVFAKTTDFITGLQIVRGFLTVFKYNSITVGRFTGSYTFPFEFEENSLDVGTLAGKTIQNIGDELIFLGHDKNVYLTDGSRYKDISKEVKKLLGERVNWNKVHLSSARIIPDEKWYMLSIPTEGQDWPFETWVLDLDDFTWQPFDYSNMLDIGFFLVTSGLTIGELTGNIGSLNWQIGSTITQPGSIVNLFSTYDGYVNQFSPTIINKSGAAFECLVDTKDFEWERRLIKKPVIFELEAKGVGSLEIWNSINEGNTWTKKGTVTLASDWKNHVLILKDTVNCQRIRFRIRNNATNEHFSIRAITPKRIDKGRYVT